MRVVIAHSRDLPASLVRELHDLGLGSVDVSLEEGYPIEARVTRAQANSIEKLDGVISVERHSTLLSDLAWMVRGSAQILGYATAVALVWFWTYVFLYERANGRRYATAPVQVSPVASRLAAKFSPQLQSLARDNREGVISNSGNAVQRLAVRTVYSAGVNAIPYATEIGADRALTYLDTLKASEVAALLIDHARSTGRQAHYSLQAAAER